MREHSLTITSKVESGSCLYGWACSCGRTGTTCNLRERDARSSFNMHVGQSRRREALNGDGLHELRQILREIGATLTYYGKSVTESEMRDIAGRSAMDRLVRTLTQQDTYELQLAQWADDGGGTP